MDDKDLILSLGGPTKLAKRLKLSGKHGSQRVSNWMTRGIPAKVKLDHPDIFLVGIVPATQKKERRTTRRRASDKHAS